MMLSFDELNVLQKRNKQRSVSFDLYFDEMEIPESEKKIRKEFAKELEEELFTILAMLWICIDRGSNAGDIQSVKELLENNILTLIWKFTYPDMELLDYARRFASDFVDSTLRNFDKESSDPKNAYWLSEDRASYNAENEANTVFNHEQDRQAKIDGKSWKQWLTMKDEAVRRDHAKIDNQVVTIDEFFIVGGYPMRYPKDAEYGAPLTQIANCRCSVRYF